MLMLSALGISGALTVWLAGAVLLSALLLILIIRFGMFGWAMAASLISILVVLAESGPLQNILEAQWVGVPLISQLLLVVCLGMMLRILVMIRRGEREALQARLRQLEEENARLRSGADPATLAGPDGAPGTGTGAAPDAGALHDAADGGDRS